MGSVRKLISNFETGVSNDMKPKTIQPDLHKRDTNTGKSDDLINNQTIPERKINTVNEIESSEDQINVLIDAYRKDSSMCVKPIEGTSAMELLNDDSSSADSSFKVYEVQNKNNIVLVEKPRIESSHIDPLDSTSSVYPTSSDEKPPEKEIYKTLPDLDNVTDTNKTNGSSNWDDGEYLIKKFGYDSNTQSNTGDPSEETKTVTDTETIKDGSSPSKFKRNILKNWKFGDIDGLERESMKSGGSPTDYYPSSGEFASHKSRNQSPSESFINSVLQSKSHSLHTKQRSVSFKEDIDTKEIYTPSSAKSIESQRNLKRKQLNPWKYVSYGIILAVFIIYFVTLLFKELFTANKTTIILTENDFIEYFERSSNLTRYNLVRYLANKYDVELESKHNQSNLKVNKKKLNYSPRENDTEIKSVVNNFENINPIFQNDQEIKKLMTDDNLKFMFSGLAYAPEGVIEPMCGVTLRNVILDIARLSKVTGTVKTYGTQCKQAEYILESIDQLQVNFTLALGVWIGPDEPTNQNQLSEMKKLLQKYPRKYFHSIFIGNEVVYREDKTVNELIDYINDTKKYIKSLNITDLPVGTTEIGSKINNKLFEVCDIIGANIHPFFGGIGAEFGSRWALDYYYNQLISQKESLNSNTQLVISEVGWPYQGGEFMKSIAGSWEFQQFLNDWLCTSPATILNDCFYFEAFDEPWKKVWWDGNRTWETEWGFFDSERRMKKHIYIPDCSKYGNPSFIDLNYIEETEDIYGDGINE